MVATTVSSPQLKQSLPEEPYRPLAPFEAEHRALFAGREDDVDRFVDILTEATCRVLVLHGASGVGKSSFLLAGVVPWLEEENLGLLCLDDRNSEGTSQIRSNLFVRATEDPFRQIAERLRVFCGEPYHYRTPTGQEVPVDLASRLLGVMEVAEAETEIDVKRLHEWLAESPDHLATALNAIGEGLPFKPVLFIDQAEEIFTLSQEDEAKRNRQAFLRALRTAQRSLRFAKIVVSLRTEYHGRLVDGIRAPGGATGLRDYLLTDLKRDGILQVLTLPTSDEAIVADHSPRQEYGFTYAPGVAERATDDIARSGNHDGTALLAQVIGAELWRSRQQNLVTEEVLQSLAEGSSLVEGALDRHANRQIESILKEPSDRRAAWALLDRLSLRQPGGSYATAQLNQDDVERWWKTESGAHCGFQAFLENAQACRLLRVTDVPGSVSDEAELLVSLGHDALAKVAAARRVHREKEEALKRQRQRLWRAVGWAASLFVFMALLVLGLFGFARWTRANSLVDRLESAEPSSVLEIANQVSSYPLAQWRLEALVAAEPQSPEAHRKQLHAHLALLHHDKGHVEPLTDALLSEGDWDYLAVIQEVLRPFPSEVCPELWKVLHDPNQERARRFRAGLALASYQPQSDSWTEEDYRFLVDRFVAVPGNQQRLVWKFLEPSQENLLRPLTKVLFDTQRGSQEHIAAANWLGESYEAESEAVATLFNLAGGQALLFKGLGSTPAAAERLLLGAARAEAAITLLKLGRREGIFDVFRGREDPESLTQFVHRCRSRKVPVMDVLDCLDTALGLRRTKTGDERRADDPVVYGLLLTLGEFGLEDLPPSQRGRRIEQLEELYARDPSSAVHGASGWLLRQWEHEDLVARVDQTPVPYDETGERDWYVVEVDPGTSPQPGQYAEQPGKLYFTFVVFSKGLYEIGSPPNEEYRTKHELRHKVDISRPFAVTDREVIWRLFTSWPSRDAKVSPGKPDEPVVDVRWNEAALYCRWLTQQRGFGEEDQCYANEPDSLQLGRSGFRLLTEAEWEIACRGGTETAYSFGSNVTLLRHYGWCLDNSDGSTRRVAGFRPNPRGLFDMHGSVWEWCHDRFGADYYQNSILPDPQGPERGSNRVGRGGSWGSTARHCRSSLRSGRIPTLRIDDLGFRLAADPSSKPQSQQAGGAERQPEGRLSGGGP